MADILVVADSQAGAGTLAQAVPSLGAACAASPLAAPGGLGYPDAQPRWMFRERDVRRTVRELLEATGCFDGVHRSLPEDHGTSSGERLAACVRPVKTQASDRWDDAASGPLELSATLRITVMARDDDEETRDSEAERLANVVANALDGDSLGGFAMPEFTRLRDFEWLDEVDVERRIRVNFGFRYLVDRWDGFNTDP